MALPEGVTTITVRDTRTHPDGAGHRGRFTLTPDAPTVTLTGHGQIIMGTSRATWNDDTGVAAVTVLPSDTDGMNPTGWTYTLTEHPYDGPTRAYPVLLTQALGPSVDLADLAPIEPYTGDYVLVPGPSGPSAYDVAVGGGFVGTEAEWITSLEGNPGTEGASAYQVAVASDFVGTEAEWLASLKGDKGDKGETGTAPTGDTIGVTRTIDKPADEQVIASTILQEDDHLTLPVTAGGRYAIDAMLVTSGDPAGDLLLTLATPPGSTGHWTPSAITLGVSDGTGSIRLTRYDLGAPVGVGITATGLIVAPLGTLTAGANGHCTIQWAQVVSSATPTILRAGSWLRLTRMA